jgi:hypothetical protein
MVTPKTLSRLASARNRAEQAGLDATAERLELLRKELARFSTISPERRADKAAWAIGKVEETKIALAKELETPGLVLSDRRAMKDSGAILAKIGLCVCTMFGAMIAILQSETSRFLIGAGFLLATLAGAGVINHMIGSKDGKESAKAIGEILDEVRRTLTCQFWKRI